MSDHPWYARYPQDFIMGTMGMSLESRGAYSLLLDMMYDRLGPIPDEPRYIAGVLNISVRKWSSIRSELIDDGKIFVTDDGFIFNSRASFEIENLAKISRKRAENGAKGGNKKAENERVLNENSDLGLAKPWHRARVLQSQSHNNKEKVEKESPELNALGRVTEPIPAHSDELTREKVERNVSSVRHVAKKDGEHLSLVAAWLAKGVPLSVINDKATEAMIGGGGDPKAQMVDDIAHWLAAMKRKEREGVQAAPPQQSKTVFDMTPEQQLDLARKALNGERVGGVQITQLKAGGYLANGAQLQAGPKMEAAHG
jgi:uncharacterized protein YdaU (DUF1376 family)